MLIFLSAIEIGISAITNSKGEKESPWKITLFTATLPSDFLLAGKFVFHFAILILRKWIRYLLKLCIRGKKIF